MARLLARHLLDIDIRERILDSADELLARGGYAGMTMGELSERVGIAKGTTYLHFKSKEEVALSVIDRIFYAVLGELSLLSRRPSAPAVRLREMLVARVVLRHESFAHYDGSLPALLSTLRPAIHERRRRNRDQEARIFADVIEEGRAQSSRFEGLDPMPAARAMLWATDALLPSYLSAQELTAVGSIADEARRIAELLTRGLGSVRRAGR